MYRIDSDHVCSVEHRLPENKLDDHEGRRPKAVVPLELIEPIEPIEPI